jgi:hypothetical protein
MYIIWHDNDYDLALWVYKNSCLKNKQEVILRQIPKTNNENLLSSDFQDKTDYLILPYIKFATPDILIQRVNKDGTSKVLFATELMTHTPQHDHVFQRFERIFCISKEMVPVACILPSRKVKIERGSKEKYEEKYYYPNPLVIHTYLKTTYISKNPTLVFFWPENNGYLKFDEFHQTAPKIEGDIEKWFNFFNSCVEEESDLLNKEIVKNKINELEKSYPLDNEEFNQISFEDYINGVEIGKFYKLSRIKIQNTEDIIEQYKLDKNKLPKGFISKNKTVIMEYFSKGFRTDPYAGFLCGFKNLLCINNDGVIKNNLILLPRGIRYVDVSKTRRGKSCFIDMHENLNECPIDNNDKLQKFDLDKIIKHVNSGCIYSKSKHQRIFGTVPDIILFEDYKYYNNNYGN